MTGTVDWSSGTLLVTVRRGLPVTGPNQAAAISQVGAEIERASSAILVEQMRRLQFDSMSTIEELLAVDPEIINSLTMAAAGARVTDAHATTDLRHVEMSFELDLYADVLSRLMRHDRPVTLRGNIGWLPTTDYTGIVIHAADELAVHGTDRTARLLPTLSPGIYYQLDDGDGVARLMEANHLDPEFSRDWGPVFYTDDPVEAELSARVGSKPLMIIAYGAFGRYPTDVVISGEDALQILATANNRALIAEGRVAIVIDSAEM